MLSHNVLRKLGTACIYGLPFLWFFATMVLFNTTSPIESGPLSVLLAFVLIYLFVSSTLYMAVFSIMGILKYLSLVRPINKKLTYYIVSVIAMGPVFLLALNTLNQLEIKDIALVVMLVALGCFYVIRRSPKPTA